ncbi:hypothetical protein PtA15_2A706 [Puccinia triticina]|nr:uncharacterized protein PtA15_2A706 [Puccinia triticina]WAQ82389.1 hypothetical protein PtA15_2A706 [Puccinia triticina]
MTLPEGSQNYLARLDKHRRSDRVTYISSNYGQPKQGNQTTEYDEEEEISHIPISYETKPSTFTRPHAANHSTRASAEPGTGPPPAAKKPSPKRYTQRISKAARRLVPDHRRAPSGPAASPTAGTLPLAFSKHKKLFHAAQADTRNKPANPCPDYKSSLYPGDSNYPTNYSFYHRRVNPQVHPKY